MWSKGLGHAILGNLSSDQKVIELTKTAQDYRRTLTKHRKAKQEHVWTELERNKMDCIWDFATRWPTFFQIYSTSVYTCHVSNCHLHCWKIIVSCYMAMILQMKDSWSANLAFRTHK